MFFNKNPYIKKSATLPDYSSDADIVANSIKVQGIYKWIAVITTALWVVTAGGLFYKSIQPAPEPKVVEVDRLTGNAKIVTRTSIYVSEATLNNKYWIESFVTAYERYIFAMLDYDVATVKALTGDAVWDQFTKQYRGDYAKDKVLSDREIHTIKIESTTEPAPGFANVTFTITKKNQSGVVIGQEKRIATIKYKYAPLIVQSEAAQNSNPLGFVVESYITDPVNMSAAKAEGTNERAAATTPEAAK